MEEVVVVVVEVVKEADSAVEVVEVGGGDAALEDVVLLLYNTVGRLGVSMIEVSIVVVGAVCKMDNMPVPSSKLDKDRSQPSIIKWWWSLSFFL